MAWDEVRAKTFPGTSLATQHSPPVRVKSMGLRCKVKAMSLFLGGERSEDKSKEDLSQVKQHNKDKLL